MAEDSINIALKLSMKYQRKLKDYLDFSESPKALLAKLVKDSMQKRKNGVWKNEDDFPEYEFIKKNLRIHKDKLKEVDYYINFLKKKEAIVEQSAKKVCLHLRKQTFLERYYSGSNQNEIRRKLREGLKLSKNGLLYLSECITEEKNGFKTVVTNGELPYIHSITPFVHACRKLKETLQDNKTKEVLTLKKEKKRLTSQDLALFQKVIGEASNISEESFEVIGGILAIRSPKAEIVHTTITYVADELRPVYQHITLAVKPNSLWAPTKKVQVGSAVEEVFKELNVVLRKKRYFKAPAFLGKSGKYIATIDKMSAVSAYLSLAVGAMNTANNPSKIEAIRFSGDLADKAHIIGKGLEKIKVLHPESKLIKGAILKKFAAVGAIIGVLFSIYDAYTSWKIGDTGTVYGHLLIASGSLVFLAEGISALTGGIGMAVILIGVILVIAFTDDPLEKWFKHNFFGIEWTSNLGVNKLSNFKDIEGPFYNWYNYSQGTINYIQQINAFYTAIIPPLFTINSLNFNRDNNNRNLLIEFDVLKIKKGRYTFIINLIPSQQPFMICLNLRRFNKGKSIEYKQQSVGNIIYKEESKSSSAIGGAPGTLTMLPLIKYKSLKFDIQVPSFFWGNRNWKGIEIFAMPYNDYSSKNMNKINAVPYESFNKLIGPVIRKEF